MKIAYCSLLLPEEKNLIGRAKKRLPGISLHRFGKAVISGLEENEPGQVTVFNIINTHNYPAFPQLVFPTEQWSHSSGARDWHIGYINLFGIKYITQKWGLYKKLKAWRKEQGDEPCVICVHHIYYPAMAAACKMKKKFGDKVRICLLTGDMNGQYGLKSQRKVNMKQRMINRMNRMIDAMALDFDSFVFATKYMAAGFGVENKPHTVMECAFRPESSDQTPAEAVETGLKTIFYAGALREEYGIPHLLRAFSMIDDPSYRLQLAGDVSAASMLRTYMDKDPRIEFLGFITPAQVDAFQRKATVLINPRVEGNYEYVKYSFPSKALECLASGKPYIAHVLPCDPPEYAAHIQYAADESDEALRDKIIEICSLPEEKRTQIAKDAKEFVLREKNPCAMTKRIIEMWQALF